MTMSSSATRSAWYLIPKDDHVYSEALRIGVNEFIEKPFSVDSFLELLALMLKKKKRR
jgi:DNA-binding NtrC family response regulator